MRYSSKIPHRDSRGSGIDGFRRETARVNGNVNVPCLNRNDDKFLLDMYAMKFSAEGFAVQASLSAKDALSLLKQGLAPAVILFDLTMPECDGYSDLQGRRANRIR